MIELDNFQKYGRAIFYEGADGAKHYYIDADHNEPGCFILTVYFMQDTGDGDYKVSDSQYAFSSLSSAIKAIEKMESGKVI